MLICSLGALCFKIVPALLCLGFIKLFHAEKYEMLVLAVIGWVSLLFIAWPIGRYIIGLGVHMMEYGERFKYSYLFHIGKDVPEPCFDQYNLSEEEFRAYMSRFSFRDLDYSLSVGAFGLAGLLWFKMEFIQSARLSALLGLALMFTAGIATHVIIQWIDLICARHFPQHERAERYIEAKLIYEEVQKELLGLQSGQTDDN